MMTKIVMCADFADLVARPVCIFGFSSLSTEYGLDSC